MSDPKPLSGFVGNLSEVQEFRLKEMYLAYLITIGMLKPDAKVGLPLSKSATEVHRSSRFSLRGNHVVQAEASNMNECLMTLKTSLKDLKIEDTNEYFRTACRSDHPDSLMLRFLRARKWETSKALGQFGDTLYWREKGWNIEELLLRGEHYYIDVEPDNGFINQYKSGKVNLHGYDKQGRPIVYVHVAKHDPKAQSEKAMERYTLNIIENCRLCLTKEVNTAAIVFDMTNFGLSNMDYGVVKFILSCFEHYYPECLGYIFVHQAPWVFSSVWAVIKGWIDPVVASKISFTKSEKELLKFIDSDQIPKELGGTSKFEYKYIPPQEGENKYIDDVNGRKEKIKERDLLFAEFDKLTMKWVLSEQKDASDKLLAERNALADKIIKQYWTLDPYVRARSVLDRNGTLGEFKKELAKGGVASLN